MVQLEKPFVWPVEPMKEDLDRDFDRERWNKMAADRKRQLQGATNHENKLKVRLSVAEQAQRLLEGKDKWKGLDVSAVQTPPPDRFNVNMPLR